MPDCLDNALGETSVEQVLAALAEESPVVYRGKKAREATLRNVVSPRVLVLGADGILLRLEGTAGYRDGPLTEAETQPHGDAPWLDDDRTLANPLARASANFAPDRGGEHEPGDGTTNGIEIAGCDCAAPRLSCSERVSRASARRATTAL